MKALVKSKSEPGLWLADVPEPKIGINDVLIRVDRTGICGTDLHIYKWDAWARQTIPVPMVVGHEFVGGIVAVGSNVKAFQTGDVDSGEGHVVCGRCPNCMAGRRHLCADTKGVGVNRPGCFAEYLCIPVTNVWHADPRIPMDILAIFGPFGNATHTALAFEVLGEDVLITGAGPIGVMATAVARHAGARFVVTTDLNSYRLELARMLGATVALDVREESIADIQRELGMKEGFDVGLEMSGNAQALRDMLQNMFHGGKIAMLGIPSNDPKLVMSQATRLMFIIWIAFAKSRKPGRLGSPGRGSADAGRVENATRAGEGGMRSCVSICRSGNRAWKASHGADDLVAYAIA